MVARTPLTIGLVVRRFQRSGGTEGQTCALAAALAALGHRVRVYTQTVGPGAPVGPGIEVVRVGAGVGGRWRFWAATGALPRQPSEVVLGLDRNRGHDLFRAGGGSHLAWLMARDRLEGRVRRGWADRVELGLEAAAVRAARGLIANSELGAAGLRAAWPTRAAEIVVVRNAVALDRFAPDPHRRAAVRDVWSVPARGRVALFLGSGFVRKGLDTAIEAFATAGGANDRFVVAGADREAAGWRARAQARLGARLVWLGEVEEPAAVLCAADALILPSRYDASANVVLEALAAGVPPVGSGQDGAMEIVPDAQLRVADPQDGGGFTEALGYAWGGGVDRPGLRAAAAAWPASRMAQAVAAQCLLVAEGRIHGG